MQKDTPHAGDVGYIENAGQFAKSAAPPERTWSKEEEKKTLWGLDPFLILLCVLCEVDRRMSLISRQARRIVSLLVYGQG